MSAGRVAVAGTRRLRPAAVIATARRGGAGTVRPSWPGSGPPLPGIFAGLAPVLDHWGYLAVGGLLLEDFGIPVLFTAQQEAEWPEFEADCGKYEAELAAEVAKGKLTLGELDEEEQSLERLRRWYWVIRAGDLFGSASAPGAERRLKEYAEALERFVGQVCQAREHPEGGPG